ncbi:alpha-keto acid decarboxylase family protein [bacterium]|nr:alpha-keto acid decarboxylase family protein [bacterium]
MPTTVGQYLLYRLKQLSVRHIFGVPGDFVLGFNKLIELTPDIEFINTCDEQGAGFAADAYARINGFGVICITYCVGGLKVANPVAEAFAEKSPVLVISGGPGVSERRENRLLHHRVRDFYTQKHVFDQLTVAATILDHGERAISEIDRVIQAVVDHNRPGYIELPRDMVNYPISMLEGSDPIRPTALPLGPRFNDMVSTALAMIDRAQTPVILVDAEIHRFRLHDTVRQFAETLNIPMAATVLGKSTISETHPLYIGVYEGGLGHDSVRDVVESSDCQILLGVLRSDMNTGVFTANLDPAKSIDLTYDRLIVGGDCVESIPMGVFLDALIQSGIAPKSSRFIPHPPEHRPFVPEPVPVSVRRVFDAVNSRLTEDMVVISDVGDALFGAMDLVIQSHTEFISPAYYASIGFAVPASVGAALASPARRPIVIVGDGAFQMTGNELSTAIRYGLTPIIIILNNGGYGTERPMLDGPFNDIFNWNYSRLPEIYNSGVGIKIRSEHDLNTAIDLAVNDDTQCYVLEVILDRHDRSDALNRLTAGLGAKV